MTPQKRKTLIIALVILCLCTIIVYTVPKRTIRFFSQKNPIESTLGSIFQGKSSSLSDERLIKAFQSLSSAYNKNITSTVTLHGMIDGPLLSYGTGTVLSGTVEVTTDHIINISPFQESSHYQIDGDISVFSGINKLYTTLYNAHSESLSYEKQSYIKLNEQDLIQEGPTSPTIILWQSLLNHYKDTWIIINQPSLSIHKFLENIVSTIRILEVSKDETYVELEGPILQFSGTVINSSESFSGTFSFSGSQMNGSIESIKDEPGLYDIVIEHDNKYKATFNGRIKVGEENNTPSLLLEGIITRPAGITLNVSIYIDNEKIGSVKSKKPPKQYIKWRDVKTNLLGVK